MSPPKIKPVVPDNRPTRARRPDPDAETSSANPPAAGHMQPGTAPAPPQAVPAMSDPVNTFVHMFTGSDETDTEDGPGVAGDRSGSAVIDAMLTRPTVDPDQRLVHFGARIPEYMVEAIRLIAFAQRRRQQDIVIEALRHGLDPAVLARARRAAGGGQ